MDEGKLNKQREKAVRAQHLLEDELLNEAFDEQIKAIIELWKTSETQTPEFRERLWYQYQGIEGAREHLQKTLTNGKHAETELLKIVKEPSRLKRFFS